MTEPTDVAARRRIRDGYDASLFVEAGAGTGKTTALVDRVVALVRAGHVELRQLAAITFTDAAAAELRDRVRAAIEAGDAHADGRLFSAAARDRCATALDQLDEAALTTLHGFAQRLLSERPFDVGLPPGFRVVEEVEASVVFEQRWGRVVDRLFDDPSLEPALVSWFAAGFNLALLRAVALRLCASYDRLRPPRPAPPLGPLRHADLVTSLDRIADLRRDQCRADDDKLAAHIDQLRPVRDALASATEPLDVLEALFAVPNLVCSHGRKACWVDVDAARQACKNAEEERRAIVDERLRGALELLAEQLVRFALEYANERRREGRLEFHDLLVLARDLLRDHPAARAAAATRYRCVLLDEFQDTDPLQIELAVLLTAADLDAPPGPWSEVPVRDGSLTLVGDPKQSIYRFRRADLGVYHEARERLGLEPVTLVENFRSVPRILDVVNTAFTELLAEVPGVQAAHVPLVAHRDGAAVRSRVATLGGGHAASIGAIREVEAAEVAATVQQIVAEGWPVQDRDGCVRAAEARDIALLIPSRTVLPALEAALESAGVPVRVESQSLVYATAEVRDVLAILAAIDDPTDELALVAALRSPAFGCSDAELVAHVEAGGGWDYRVDPPGVLPGPDPVGEGLRSLHELGRARWWRSVSGTVEAVIRDRRLLELAARHRRPRDHWRRLRFLLDQARAWEDAGETSLRRFIEWVQRQAAEGVRVNESVVPEPDDHAVRVLTIHGAKGLEFPIVILAGLNTQPQIQRPVVLWGPDAPQLRVGRSGMEVETLGYGECFQTEQQHQQAERLRLLYVAMTRARDHLVMSLHHKEGAKSHAALLAPRLDGTDHDVLTPATARPPAAPRAEAAPASADPVRRESWIAARQALLEHAGRPASVSATALAELAAVEAPEVQDGVGLDARPPWRRGRAATALGRAVHAVLQTIDLDTAAGLDTASRAQAFAEGVPDREREVRALVASVLAAPIVRAAVTGRWDRWREVPVAAVVEDVLVEGFIDLLIRSPAGLVVVDYKTDWVSSPGELDAAVARYAIQGGAYALALEAALGEPIVQCVFVFARTPEAVERQADLAGAAAAARERLAAFSVI